MPWKGRFPIQPALNTSNTHSTGCPCDRFSKHVGNAAMGRACWRHLSTFGTISILWKICLLFDGMSYKLLHKYHSVHMSGFSSVGLIFSILWNSGDYTFVVFSMATTTCTVLVRPWFTFSYFFLNFNQKNILLNSITFESQMPDGQSGSKDADLCLFSCERNNKLSLGIGAQDLMTGAKSF